MPRASAHLICGVRVRRVSIGLGLGLGSDPARCGREQTLLGGKLADAVALKAGPDGATLGNAVRAWSAYAAYAADRHLSDQGLPGTAALVASFLKAEAQRAAKGTGSQGGTSVANSRRWVSSGCKKSSVSHCQLARPWRAPRPSATADIADRETYKDDRLLVLYACYVWEGYITAHEAYGTHTLDARQCRPGSLVFFLADY